MSGRTLNSPKKIKMDVIEKNIRQIILLYKLFLVINLINKDGETANFEAQNENKENIFIKCWEKLLLKPCNKKVAEQSYKIAKANKIGGDSITKFG